VYIEASIKHTKMAGPYSTEIVFEDEVPLVGAVLLKLFEVTELMVNCKTGGNEDTCWHLIDPITSMEIDLMVYEQSYVLFSWPFDVSHCQPDKNAYLLESTLFVLQQLGGKTEQTLEPWAGESWSTAKWRWSLKDISRRDRT
jgi:hypothetical protein